jgi:hypothetical protein
MKRAALSLMLCFAVAGSLYAAQAPSSQQQPSSPAPSAPAPASPAQASQDKPADVTLTGCLVQGSAPSVFILENAKLSTASATDKGKSYVVVVTGAADLKPHLNHQVRIVGAESQIAAASPGASREASQARESSAKQDESSFPRLNARTVTMVANTCPA